MTRKAKAKGSASSNDQRQLLQDIVGILSGHGLRPDLAEKIEAALSSKRVVASSHHDLLCEVGGALGRFGARRDVVEKLEALLGKEMPTKIEIESPPLSRKEESLRWMDLQGAHQWRTKLHRLNVALENLMVAPEGAPVDEQRRLALAVNEAHRESNAWLTTLRVEIDILDRDSAVIFHLQATMQNDLALWTQFASVRDRFGDPTLSQRFAFELQRVEILLEQLRSKWAAARWRRSESERRQRVGMINNAQPQGGGRNKRTEDKEARHVEFCRLMREDKKFQTMHHGQRAKLLDNCSESTAQRHHNRWKAEQASHKASDAL